MPKFLFTGRPPEQVEFPPEASDRKGAAHLKPGTVITLTRAEVLWITSHRPNLARRLKTVGAEDKVEDGAEVAPTPADPWASVRKAPTPADEAKADVVEDLVVEDLDDETEAASEDEPEPEPDKGERRKRAGKRKGKGKGKASTD